MQPRRKILISFFVLTIRDVSTIYPLRTLFHGTDFARSRPSELSSQLCSECSGNLNVTDSTLWEMRFRLSLSRLQTVCPHENFHILSTELVNYLSLFGKALPRFPPGNS